MPPKVVIRMVSKNENPETSAVPGAHINLTVLRKNTLNILAMTVLTLQLFRSVTQITGIAKAGNDIRLCC